MSRKQGSRAAGMRPAANAAGERLDVASITDLIKERAV